MNSATYNPNLVTGDEWWDIGESQNREQDLLEPVSSFPVSHIRDPADLPGITHDARDSQDLYVIEDIIGDILDENAELYRRLS